MAIKDPVPKNVKLWLGIFAYGSMLIFYGWRIMDTVFSWVGANPLALVVFIMGTVLLAFYWRDVRKERRQREEARFDLGRSRKINIQERGRRSRRVGEPGSR